MLKIFGALLLVSGLRAGQFEVTLPAGVTAVSDLNRAYHETTPSRERICINGLWRWQPAKDSSIPSASWGFFKVPGAWPGITDYMRKDSQKLYPHEAWKNVDLAGVTSAWYEREINIPGNWAGRRIVLSTAYLNSFAVAYLDGKRAGEIRFPAGEIDLTALCRPGEKQLLTIRVDAMPLKGVLLSYTDSASAREVKGSVPRRGLCGDVFLEGVTDRPGIGDVIVNSSVRKQEITVSTKLRNLRPNTTYAIRASASVPQAEATSFESSPFTLEALHAGEFVFTNRFASQRLWDIHTPSNQYTLSLQLLENGAPVDQSKSTRFGFREFWIDGRDFYLNGTRIFLSAVPLDNAEVGAASSTYTAARESLERLKSFGINFVYTHNYGCEPGSHLSFDEILRAADDVGMLVALSQPHFSHYEWKSADADRTNGYATHAAFYTKVAANHPSIVFYSMSHNATGYNEDMNPAMIDGIQAPRDRWASNNMNLALRAQAIVNHLDPSRIVYHHASGNLGSMHDMNFYPNFVPIQELSDWYGHWATNGVKPAFMCEYGAPFTWDWTMYRGWYRDKREFGSAMVPWEYCSAEWNAQFLGDRAYKISEQEKVNLRWEAKRFRNGDLWHRWDYPFQVGSTAFDDQYLVSAMYLTDNWRAFRGWAVSGISPWEYEHFWKLRPGVNRSTQNLPVEWNDLQRPGYSPDYLAQRYERMDMAFEKSDWIPTPAAEALIRNNRPLLAFISGKPEAFTSKDHNFFPGEHISKQIIVINNSREPVKYNAEWSILLPDSFAGGQAETLPTGQQARIPLSFDLPSDIRPGSYVLHAKIDFDTGESQQDDFKINILPRPSSSPSASRIALFDPKGETETLLKSQNVSFNHVDANGDLSSYDILIVGKNALTLDGPAPDISRVRDGLRVIIFEQSSEVLEKRLGFRVEEYGLRQVWPRIPDHPVLASLTPENLRDWRGDSTLLPPQLDYEMRPRYGPTVKWCDIPVTRVWRCGNRGNVASVLIEKPPRGDFLPILDGGYALQFSPLLEYPEGQGMILFCQLDLTARTESDPAAETIARNILRYVQNWKPEPKRKVLYDGAPEGKAFLEQLGVAFDSAQPTATKDILVVGPGGKEPANWQRDGGKTLAIGLSSAELTSLSAQSTKREHISTYFDAPSSNSPFRGLSPADLHNRAPREFDLITDGAQTLGDGIIASSKEGNVTFLQMHPWQFKGDTENLRRTYRRVSFACSRILANLGAECTTPLLDRFQTAPDLATEKRWLTGLYLDTPEEWDDPYRFFRW